MKKKYLVSVLALAGLSVTGITEVQADSSSDLVNTNGEAGFVVDGSSKIPIVKPGTNEEIEVDEPTNQINVANVRLSYVPSFYFGSKNTLEVTSVGSTTTYPVKNDLFQETITVTDEQTGTESEKKQVVEIPQFVQVADTSGKVGTTWEVNVKQSGRFTSTEDHELRDTRIMIDGQTLKNTRDLESNIEGIAALALETPKTVFIPVTATDAENNSALSVLKKRAVDVEGSETSVDTVGSKSSIVFQKDYNHEDLKTSTAEMTKEVTKEDGTVVKERDVENRGTNTDVFLAVPEKDSARADVYSTTLVWTLVAGI